MLQRWYELSPLLFTLATFAAIIIPVALLSWWLHRVPKCKQCGHHFKRRPTYKEFYMECETFECSGRLFFDGTQTADFVKPEDMKVRYAEDSLLHAFAFDGRKIPLRKYAMTCEHVGCQCHEGQDYIREVGDICYEHLYAQPIFLCEQHSFNHTPIKKEEYEQSTENATTQAGEQSAEG